MAEQEANDVQTTLAAPIGAGDVSLSVQSAAGFPNSGTFRIRIDDEIITVGAVSGATFTGLVRASEPAEGVQQAAGHAQGATVAQVLTQAGLLALITQAVPAALPTVATPGTYGDASHYVVITIDAQGRVVGVSTQAVPGGNPFPDDLALVKNSVDGTKQVILSAASVSPGTVRTLTVPDASGTIALLSVGNTFTVGPQTINTGADANKGLVIARKSATQTGNLAEFQQSAGEGGAKLLWVDASGYPHVKNAASANDFNITTQNAEPNILFNIGGTVAFGIRSNGYLQLGASGLLTQNQTFQLDDTNGFSRSGVWKLMLSDPSNQLLIQANHTAFSAGRAAFYLNNASTVSTSDLLQVLNNGTPALVLGPGGNGYALEIPILNTADKGLVIQAPASQTGVVVQLQGTSSTSTLRPQADLDTAWVSSTDATRKSRFVIRVWDTVAREAFRVESDGTQALTSFYGVPAVARQLLATGAGHTVDDVIGALQNLGIFRQS